MAAISFAADRRAGALFLVTLIVVAPRLAAGALVAFLTGWLLARLLGLSAALREEGVLLYNVLLVGMGAGWLGSGAAWSWPAQCAAVAGAAATAVLISAALLHIVGRTIGLPPLSLTFVAVFGALLWWFPQVAAIASWTEPSWLPEPAWLPYWPAAFLRSCGIVFFMPHVVAGTCVLLGLLLWSRLAVLYGAAGYVGGILMVLALQEFGVRFDGVFPGHNYILAGLALGSVYFMPSLASAALAAAAGAFAAVMTAAIQHVLRGSGWEFLPLPFILTVWCFLGAMRLRDAAGALRPRFPLSAGLTPEADWRRHALAIARFPHGQAIHLAAPFAGACTVTQGVDGPLSHRGAWRHALDFECLDDNGEPAPHPQAAIGAYHTWGLPVCAPAAGEILEVVDHVADNPPGICNFAQNWGNYVVLRTGVGAHVLLAHFQQGGVHVRPGQRVRQGEILGRCGNSGRSPVPHIHLHVQETAAPGSPTVPFVLANYQVDRAAASEWISAGVPRAGERIAAAAVSPRVLEVLGRLPPGRVSYRAEVVAAASADQPFRRAQVRAREDLEIRLDDAGRYRFCSGPRGENFLVAAVSEKAWVTLESNAPTSLFLRCLAIGLPSAPFAESSGLWWQDAVDGGAWSRHRGLAEFAGPFIGLAAARTLHCYRPRPLHERGVTVRAEVRNASRTVPSFLEIRFEPAQGITSLTAAFAGSILRFSQIARNGSPAPF